VIDPVSEVLVKLREPAKKFEDVPLNVVFGRPRLSVTLFIPNEVEPPEMSPL